MISRFRPYFTQNYFNALSDFDPDTPRKEYRTELTRQLRNYYPKAHTFEFLNYGRNSLGAGLDLFGIQKNDEILLPCFTCSTVLEPILRRGIIPKLIDINFDFSLNTEKVRKSITEKTKAVVATHFFGIPADISEIKEIADTYGLFLIEDCAHIFCHRTPSPPGSTGDIAFTSHGNEKPFPLGNGSVLIVNNAEKAGSSDLITRKIPEESLFNEKCSFLSLACFDYATEPDRYNNFIGVYDFYTFIMDNQQTFQSTIEDLIQTGKIESIYKLFMEDFQRRKNLNPIWKIVASFQKTIKSAAHEQHDPKLMNSFLLHLLVKVLPEIDRVNESRMKKGRIYIDNLAGNTDFTCPQNNHAPYLRYPIVCKKSALTASVVKKLRDEKFEVGNYNWGRTLGQILKVKEKFETAEYISDNIINLPCYPSLHDEEILRIIRGINNFTQ